MGRNKKGKIIENSEKICPYSAYTCQGPQGSINVRVALVCLNMALNRKIFVHICVYALVRHAKDVYQWN